MSVVRPGDVIGECHPGWGAGVIRIGTLAVWNPINHVKVVVRHPDYKTLLVFESTTGETRPCLFARRVVKGVQAHSLAQAVLDAHAAGVQQWHYPLMAPLAPFREEGLAVAAERYLGRPYDYVGALRARTLGFGWLCHLLPNREDLGNLFCSEYGVILHRAVDRFATSNASKWNPAHWMRVERLRNVVQKPTLLTPDNLEMG